jgi:hypothetical protein
LHPGNSAFSVLGWFNNNQVTRAAVGSASGAFLPTLTALLGNVAYFLAGTAPQVFPLPPTNQIANPSIRKCQAPQPFNFHHTLKIRGRASEILFCCFLSPNPKKECGKCSAVKA